MTDPIREPQAFPIYKVVKADTQIATGPPLSQEDAFSGLYLKDTAPTAQILEPTFNPATLEDLVTRNNILLQCVQAMEVNVDGTGWEIRLDPELKDTSDDEAEKERLMAFFKECYPGMSFTTLRRQLRVDLESVGCGYVEVMRNLAGEIVFLRHLEAKTMRLLKLSEPRLVEKTFHRGGKEQKVKLWVRERRFAQRVGVGTVYFKEFGCTRDVNRDTGDWAEEGKKLRPEQQASEILYFTTCKDAKTAYGVPRWINQLPSVLGSRKAEEFNLEFFDNGGLPPVIVFVEGGALAPTVAEVLRAHIGGQAAKQNRGAVVEVMPAGGSLDNPGKVNVRVERFGSERTADAMFQTYDKTSEDHIRVAFRLPPLFIGRSDDLNFASAKASYLVAEAQVFAPEREKFDEVINTTILRALGATKYEFRSLPLSVADVEVQIKALTLAQPNLSGEQLIEAVNDIAALDLVYDQEADPAQQQQAMAQEAQEQAAQQLERSAESEEQEMEQPKEKEPAKKLEVDDLVDSVLLHQGLISHGVPMEPVAIQDALDDLTSAERDEFKSRLADRTFSELRNVRGLGDLMGCLTEFLE